MAIDFSDGQDITRLQPVGDLCAETADAVAYKCVHVFIEPLFR